ncbi:hypothetical protein BSKO_12931 [Bryopsis sp. KO-2023]|nr:hypothetical protein BSKO_12931 [Bryopsis sp. KO-2023]
MDILSTATFESEDTLMMDEPPVVEFDSMAECRHLSLPRNASRNCQPYHSEALEYGGKGGPSLESEASVQSLGLGINDDFDDVAEFIVEEDAGGSESDDFDETVRREHLKFLEQQQRRKEAAAKGRAWSAPARPTSLSSPSSAVQRKRSAERSGEPEFEVLETPRVEYSPASCNSHGRTDESPRQHMNRPKSAFEIGRDFFLGLEHAEQFEGQHGLQDIMEDAPFVSQGTSESEPTSSKMIDVLRGGENVSRVERECTERPLSRMESHNALPGSLQPDERILALPVDGSAVASGSRADLVMEESGVGSLDLSSEEWLDAEQNSLRQERPAWDDSTRAEDTQSGQQRQNYVKKKTSHVLKGEKTRKRPGSANRPLAYYGILGLQGKGKSSEQSFGKNRPPSAPATSQQRSKQRKQIKRDEKIDPVYRRPPSGRSAGQLKRAECRNSSTDHTTTQTTTPASLRPQSAHQLGQPTSYFDSMLHHAFPSAKQQVEKGRPSSTRSSDFGYLSCARQDEGKTGYLRQHGKIPHYFHIEPPRQAKKRARSAASSQRPSKARPETARIYAKNILSIINEANQNARKLNSRYRYRLDDRPGCHEVYLQVFDSSKGEWLARPWTMKRFLGKHYLMQERVKFMKVGGKGTGSATATPRGGKNSARSSLRGCDFDEFGFVPTHRIPNPKPVSSDYCDNREIDIAFEQEMKHQAEKRGSMADDCARKALVDALASIDGVGQNRVDFPMSPNMRKMRSELVEIEKLCRQVSTQVRLTREFV